MGVVVGFLSLKGGVGKTTLATSISSSLAAEGKQVLLVDANYSAPNVGIHMDLLCPGKTIHDVLAGSRLSSAVYSQYGVDVVPGNFLYNREVNPLKLKTRLAHARSAYDYIILDSAPTLNEELFSVLYASDELFLVSTPDHPTLSCTLKLARLAQHRNQRLSGIIVNRVSDPSYQLTMSDMQESTGVPVVLWVPEDRQVGRALSSRVPVPLFAKHSSFSQEVQKLSNSLLGVKERTSFFRKLFSSSQNKLEDNRESLREHFYTSIFSD